MGSCVRIKQSDYCGAKKRKRKRSRSRSSRGKCPCSSSKRPKRRKSRKGKKCSKAGPATVNPFLNFLRDFRKSHCGWAITKIAIEGAKAWCQLGRAEREKYYKEACRMQKKKRKRGGRSRRRR